MLPLILAVIVALPASVPVKVAVYVPLPLSVTLLKVPIAHRRRPGRTRRPGLPQSPDFRRRRKRSG